ncbi:IS3 family transposase [Candidatus Sulfidibacterium hydrothermale]|uniref:IS3 family transposase n=1 Tax=Candidatus Sulfidibacterium hydrothermale TaxID=2875962 RepID=UPI001F0AA7A4|nr:IS3 family transposase [Candidatus Sulfidibacterium hydrothermale]
MNRKEEISVKRQCELLEVNRSSFYYVPRQEGSYNQELMKLIDKQYMKTPFYGVMRMTTYLRNIGYPVNAKRVRRLYRLMDLQAIGPRPNTSKPHKGEGHTVFPYLLRNLEITHSNQVWAMDITYVPVGNGYMYLFAIIDLYSRYIVGWSLSNTMTTQWCKQTLEQAIKDHGKPKMINTDQGSQFTATEFTEFVTGKGITFSMDGKGRAIDNIFIERFWRNIKYEKLYLEPSEDGLELYEKIKDYIEFYNTQRPHQSLAYKMPVKVFKQAA